MGRALVPRQSPDAMRLTQLKSDCLAHLAALGRAKGTLESYDTTFSQFIAYVTTVLRLTDDAAHFNQERLIGFMAHLHQCGVSPNTIKARLSAMGAFARYGAIRKDHRRQPVVPVNPLVGLERPKGRKAPEKYLLPAELRAYLEVARPARVSIVRDVLVDTGLRVSELCAANVGGIRRLGAVTALAVVVKGGHSDEVPLSPAVAAGLRDWLARREKGRGVELLPEEPLFIDQHGLRYNRTGMAAMLARIGWAAGIRRFIVTPHVVRHTLELIRRRAKIDPAVRSRLLTHTSYTSLTSYQHVMPEELDQARAAQISELQRYLGLCHEIMPPAPEGDPQPPDSPAQ
jgi:site-specific recombinase XerD